jgi:hypothetical protein
VLAKHCSTVEETFWIVRLPTADRRSYRGFHRRESICTTLVSLIIAGRPSDVIERKFSKGLELKAQPIKQGNQSPFAIGNVQPVNSRLLSGFCGYFCHQYGLGIT